MTKLRAASILSLSVWFAVVNILPLPPLTGLSSFEAFARARSMTGAAAELNVTHGAVSRQVRALENKADPGRDCRISSGPRSRTSFTRVG